MSKPVLDDRPCCGVGASRQKAESFLVRTEIIDLEIPCRPNDLVERSDRVDESEIHCLGAAPDLARAVVESGFKYPCRGTN